MFPGSFFAEHVIECMLTAKKLSEQKSCGVDVFFWGKFPDMEEVYRSYNINRVISFGGASFLQKCKYVLKGMKFWASLKSVEDLLHYTYST